MKSVLKTAVVKEDLQVTAFRAPGWLRSEAKEQCEREDITFSQLMRRAIRKELGFESNKPKGAK